MESNTPLHNKIEETKTNKERVNAVRTLLLLDRVFLKFMLNLLPFDTIKENTLPVYACNVKTSCFFSFMFEVNILQFKMMLSVYCLSHTD